MHDNTGLAGCRTLMLDMDGTLLDLAYDTHLWMRRVPEAYACRNGISEDVARQRIYAVYRQLEGTLDWYCLDHWSERLNLDVLALHREQRERIAYLPGAQAFLARVASTGIRVVLVTNSHTDTLALKIEETGLDAYFDGLYSAHDIGYAKEEQAFWQTLAAKESVDPGTTVFVDDNATVLASAETFGIRRLVQITRPDTSRPAKACSRYAAVDAVANLDR